MYVENSVSNRSVAALAVAATVWVVYVDWLVRWTVALNQEFS